MGKKNRDLWKEDNGIRCVNKPQAVHIAKGWKVAPDALPIKKEAPRRRKYAPVKPNNRTAVLLPLEGQSYNPTDESHQAALATVVKKLEKKKRVDEKFVKMMSLGRNLKITGNFSADKTWEEEVNEFAHSSGHKGSKTPDMLKKATNAKKKKQKKKKKLGKKELEREARRAMKHRRHPNREVAKQEVVELEQLLETHATLQAKRSVARAQRRAKRKQNMQIKHFGRYHHIPLVPDVAPSEKLVGSLRHMSGGSIHPALDRLKSLEERNLIPARMRHTFNKRRVLKPKGEVRVKRETFGILPETTF